MRGAVVLGRRQCSVIVLASVLAVSGCFRVPQQSATLATIKDVAVSSTLLQLRAYETGRLVSGIIESAADSIAGLSRGADTRMRALQWKAASIPLVQEASLHSEPLVAVVDLWALALQQLAYFEKGDGRNAFGPSHAIALAAAQLVVAETARTFGRTLRSGAIPADAVHAVPSWAMEHPIRGVAMHRQSLLSSDWQALGIEESSLPGTVANLNRALLGITQRMGYLNESMLKQVGWRVEQATGTALTNPRTDSAFTTLYTTSAAITNALREAPADLGNIRQLLSHDLAVQRGAVFEALNQQREATIAALAGERQAAFGALRAERIATLAAVDSMTQRSIDRLQDVVRPIIQTGVIALTVLATVFTISMVVLLRSR